MRISMVAIVGWALLLSPAVPAAEPGALWTREETAIGQEPAYRLDLAQMRALLSRAPHEDAKDAAAGPIEVTIPLADGRLARFSVVESPVLEPALQARHPEIRTYAGTALDGSGTITRFDLNPRGFHALVLGPSGRSFVSPAAKDDVTRYVSRDRQDTPLVHCGAEASGPVPVVPEAPSATLGAGDIFTYQNERRIYHLVAAATAQFVQANGPTPAEAFTEITTVINGVNAIYRRDLGVHLLLLAASENLMYTNSSSDPYTSGSLSCLSTPPPCSQTTTLDCLLTENQCHIDEVVGNANYDLSIVFDAGSWAQAALNSVCDNTQKGRGMSIGLGVDIAAHEIGHMFGGHHTFNDGMNGSCAAANQRDPGYAVEPASGSTVMSYGGTCDSGDLQKFRSLDFGFGSIFSIMSYTTLSTGDTCPGYGFTGNYAPIVQSFTAGPYTVPAKTPFALSVDAYDPNGDPVTYSWEQANIFGTLSPPYTDDGTRPIFRTYEPTNDPERWFPSKAYVLDDEDDNVPPATVDCGDDDTCQSGEVELTTTRNMSFVVVIRDGQDGVTIGHTQVNSHAGSGPFKVTQPYDPIFMWWTQGGRREVRWDVANTNQSPVSCANVRITLSVDNGITFPHVLANSTPNDGAETITVPFVLTNNARIKVEGVGNVFFDVSPRFGIEELKVTHTGDSGRNSLRQAIHDANAYPFGATIPLQIGGTGVRTIDVLTPLPALVNPIILDSWGLGGPEYEGPPLLELNGASCTGPFGTACDGLTLVGHDSYVNGVVINRFSGNGIAIVGPSSQLHIVQNSYIGTTADGTADAGNGASGVLIDNGHDNLLWRNVISGNKVGVTIQGVSATDNHLQRNYVGTNAAGTARIPNDDDGVRIVGAPGNVIGGDNGDERNVISGNGRFNPANAFVETFADAIDISGSGAAGNVVQGNYIGLNAAGTAGLDNTEHGVRINGAPNALVGGTTAAARNVFADSLFINMNLSHGIYLQGAGATGAAIQGNWFGLDATGTVKLGIRGAGVVVDSPAALIGGALPGARNVFVNARNYGGVWLGGLSSGSQVRGNYFGIDPSGSVKFGIVAAGITAWTGNHTITGNVLSGVAGNGIDIRENGASGNTIQGNLIGLDAGGTQDFGNVIGISILRSGNNLIGGTTAATRNVISGNDQFGLYIAGPPGPAGANVVQGNYIGTNAAGAAAVPNQTGVNIYETVNVTFGGPAAGAGNLVSGNQANGTELGISDPPTGILVQGNAMGTNAAGTGAIPNGGSGLWVGVNGAVTILDNVLSGNAHSGLELCCRPTTGTIKGNRFGTDRTGTLSIPNIWHGISLGSGSMTVGGVAAGEGNVVAFNSSSSNFPGIGVAGGSGHRLRGNAVFSNFALGVDIGGLGVQPNDACDPDSGPNGLQNYPVLTAANQSGPSTLISGTLNSTASTTFDVDLYVSPSCDASGFGEGATYVGSTTVTTDGSCNGSFSVPVPGVLSGAVTAIATSPTGSSSEFSACRTVAPSAIAEVGNVTWTGKTSLSWSAASGAADYRVLRGVIADFGKLLDQTLDSCERVVVAATSTGPVLAEDPSAVPGRLFWYLVVGRNGLSEGPAGPASAGPRLANVSGSCP